VDNRASASGPEDPADLIIFDGVFDRRIRVPAPAEAIDQLDADRKSADAAALEARIAAAWAMVREIDPELARLTSKYANPPG